MKLPLLLALFLLAGYAQGCSPGPGWPPPFDESFDAASSIFIGKVTNIENYENELDQGFCVNVTMDVLTTYKGNIERGDSMTISTASNSALCGYTFTDAETYVVWSSAGSQQCGGNEQVDILGRTTLISSEGAQEDLQLLEEATREERDEGVCLYTKRCCVEDCCGVGTKWSSDAQKCVGDPSSEGFTGVYSADYNPDCEPQYPCCEGECCSESLGTYYDAFIAYCMPSATTSSTDCGPRPASPNYLCADQITTAGPGDCVFDEEIGAYAWEFVQCPECESDSDCAGPELFCSSGECRAFGSCQDLNDCLNPANLYPVIECVGYLQCSEGQCGIQCSGSMCPPGIDQGDCSSSKCAVTRCGNPSVSCVDDPCAVDGECSAIFFDASGNVACGPNWSDPLPECVPDDCGPPPPGAPLLCPDNVTVTGIGSVCEYDFEAQACVWGSLPCPSCDTNEDCGDVGQFYCSKGLCRAHGSCEDILDCKNPSNEYFTIQCVGFDTCIDNQCGVDCSTGNQCPDNDLVNCLANPCEEEECDDQFTCVSDYCGGCNAIFFDTAGNQICTDDKLPKCNSSEECGENQYCQRGFCVDIGLCEDTFDCQNPANTFDKPDCEEGYPQCGSQNQCEFVCETICPGGETLGECDFDPCIAATCIAPSTCVNDFCICEAVFFDPAGNVAC